MTTQVKIELTKLSQEIGNLNNRVLETAAALPETDIDAVEELVLAGNKMIQAQQNILKALK